MTGRHVNLAWLPPDASQVSLLAARPILRTCRSISRGILPSAITARAFGGWGCTQFCNLLELEPLSLFFCGGFGCTDLGAAVVFGGGSAAVLGCPDTSVAGGCLTSPRLRPSAAGCGPATRPAAGTSPGLLSWYRGARGCPRGADLGPWGGTGAERASVCTWVCLCACVCLRVSVCT